MKMNSFFEPADKKELETCLKKVHAKAVYPIWVIIYKKTATHQPVNYTDVLEAAICYGLIDTQSKTIDEKRYAICLRARTPGGNWTATNVEVAEKLIKQGRMKPAGLKAFKAR